MSKGGLRPAAWRCTTLALAALLNDTGCLRFAYNEVDRKTGSAVDAGMDAGASQNRADASSQPDAQLTAAGGSGGVGGRASGAGGSTALAGSGGAASNAGASVEAGGAGASDAAVADAGFVRDAGVMDGSTPAAGSGGGGGAAGSTTGAGGSGVTSVPWDQCVPDGVTLLFCNGFEEPLPWENSVWGYAYTINGTYERNTSTKYYGAASGHFITTGSDTTTGSRIAYDSLHGKKSGEVWFRYYYNIPKTVDINVYLSAGVMSQKTKPYTGFSLLIYPDSVTIENGFNRNTPPKSLIFPRDTWVCLEHHVVIDGTNGILEIYMNGDNILRSDVGNTIPAAGFDTAEVGIHYVPSGEKAADVYVDNVVVSTSRFGCDP